MKKLFWRIVDRLLCRKKPRAVEVYQDDLYQPEERLDEQRGSICGLRSTDLQGIDARQLEKEFKQRGWSEYGPLGDWWMQIREKERLSAQG